MAARRSIVQDNFKLILARLLLFAIALMESAHAASPGVLSGARVAFEIQDVATIPGISLSRPPRLNGLISPPDNSHRLFVVDMDGAILIVQDGVLLRQPFLDLARHRAPWFMKDALEQGLISMAFHPDFARAGRPGSGKFYTFSTEQSSDAPVTFPARPGLPAPTHYDVVCEWSIDASDPSKADVRSRRELLRIPHPLEDHVGGQLAFNPNAQANDPEYGLLYVSVGDGGNTIHLGKLVDEWRTAQNKLLPLGKILRINPLPSGSKPYSVPNENPFASDPKTLPEIWAYGLRNPQRISWDTGGDHVMLITDLGQKQFEEINIGHSGGNYGWSEREGFSVVDHADEYHRQAITQQESALRFIAPALAYGRSVGIAITGGYVSRRTDIPELNGKYLFGDIASGKIFATDVAMLKEGAQPPFYELPVFHHGKVASMRDVVGNDRVDLRFGTDDLGYIYIMSKREGTIRRIVRAVSVDAPIAPVERPLER